MNNRGFYHRECYKAFANISEVNRAEKRFNDAIQQCSSTSIERKVGRPSTMMYTEETTEESMLTRSQTVPYDKKACVICQKPGGILHMVEVKTTGNNMHSVTEQLADKSFFRRLNSIPAAKDATANDFQYQNLCWAKARREVERLNTPVKDEDFIKTLSDIEIIHLIDTHLSDPSGKVQDMNMVNNIYCICVITEKRKHH